MKKEIFNFIVKYEKNDVIPEKIQKILLNNNLIYSYFSDCKKYYKSSIEENSHYIPLISKFENRKNNKIEINLMSDFLPEIEKRILEEENLIDRKEEILETREFSRKTNDFNLVLSVGVLIASIYYFYEIFSNIFGIYSISLVSGIFIILIVCLLFMMFYNVSIFSKLLNSFYSKLIFLVSIITISFLLNNLGMALYLDGDLFSKNDNNLLNLNISEINQNSDDILNLKNETNQTNLQIEKLKEENQKQNQELLDFKKCLSNNIEKNKSLELCLK